MNVYQNIVADLLLSSSKEKAISMQRFFKTGKGEYGEGDVFYGVTVPQQRLIAKKHTAASNEKTVESLLHSVIHEQRLTGIFIMVNKFKIDAKSNNEEKWIKLYLNHTKYINNWDLVDSSAHLLLGKWLENKDRQILYDLATSPSLWENRIAVVANLHFIRKNDFTDILKLSKIMLSHQHDLLHKATGWMLREVWEKAPEIIESFLTTHAKKMPRTMLRYTIEKMTPEKRTLFMKR